MVFQCFAAVVTRSKPLHNTPKHQDALLNLERVYIPNRHSPEQCGDVQLVVTCPRPPPSTADMDDVEESSAHVASKATRPSPETLTSA